MTSLYSKKAVDVDRVLLVRYPDSLSLRELAKEAHVSLGQTFKIVKTLINERIAIRDSGRSGLKLMAPQDLLKRLAAVTNFSANTEFLEYYTPEEDISLFLEKLKKLDSSGYAVTGLAGAMLVAPLVRPTNVHIYVRTDADAKALAGGLGLMPVEENGNVKFAVAKSEGVFYGAKAVGGVTVVSDVQLYMDLLNYPARGEEAASELYRLIENKWKRAKVG